MLTQDNCSQCIALKNYLEMGLRNAYADKIDVVHRSEKEDEFNELVEKYQIMSTPALIAENGDVLRNTAVSNVKPFLDSHL